MRVRDIHLKNVDFASFSYYCRDDRPFHFFDELDTRKELIRSPDIVILNFVKSCVILGLVLA